MIPLPHGLSLDEGELIESFVRASGPGGQNVNKVSTAVQLRFDALNSPSLPAWLKERLIRLAGRRASREGIITFTAQRFNSQLRNREDAQARLIALIEAAADRPVVRRATRPSLGAKNRRMEAKGRRAAVKTTRQAPREE